MERVVQLVGVIKTIGEYFFSRVENLSIVLATSEEVPPSTYPNKF